MSSIFVVLLNFLLCSKVTATTWSGPYSSPEKTKFINVLTGYVSNWVTPAEYEDIMKIAEPLVYSNSSCSSVGGAVVADIGTIFSGPQYAQILALAASLTAQLPLGPLSYASLLTELKNCLWNNINPFYTQIQTWITYNEWNHTQAGTVQNVYRLANEFLTSQRTCTILTRLAESFNSSKCWTPIRSSSIGTWILWSRCGL